MIRSVGFRRLALAVLLLSAHSAQKVNATSANIVLNLEVDYQVCAGHDHALTQEQIDALEDVFACEDITLNIVIDDALDSLGDYVDRGQFCCSIAPLYNDHWLDPNWCYALLVDEIGPPGYTLPMYCSGYTGCGETFSLLVRNSKDFASTSTILHEFGHYLHLEHWGTVGPIANMKPNYPSVMNYRYIGSLGLATKMSLDGLNPDCAPFKALDFSHGTLPDINEAALLESAGIGLGPVDWNCDGIIDTLPLTLPYDVVQQWRCPSTTKTDPMDPPVIISDHDDWSFIKARFGPGQHLSASATPVDAGSCSPSSAIPYQAPMATASCNVYAFEWGNARRQSLEISGHPYDINCELAVTYDGDGDGLVDSLCDPCIGNPFNDCCCRHTGDADGDLCFGYADIDFMVDYLFFGGINPKCMEEADVDASGFVDAVDMNLMITKFFYGGVTFVCGTAE